MTQEYKNCPRCNGKKIVDLENKIKCLDCKLTFNKKIIKLIEDKAYILANEENEEFLREILDSKNINEFIGLLNEVDEDLSHCPYCFGKIEKHLKICPFCGIFLNDYAKIKN